MPYYNARKYYRNMPKLVPVRVTETATKINVSAPYHDRFNQSAGKLVGGFGPGGWAFPVSCASEVRQLIQRCFGEGDPASAEEIVTMRIRAIRNVVASKG